VFAKTDIEAVSVCLPNFLHYPVSRAALLAGRSVICEKPPTMHAREMEDLGVRSVAPRIADLIEPVGFATNSPVNFLRSRADQLADYLRGCLARGELKEPLPSSRSWSVQLGVGHSTLEAALQVLEREGRLRVLPRQGVRLVAAGHARTDAPPRRLVRLLYLGADYPDISHMAELFQVLFARLDSQGIHFSVESCDVARARRIHQRGERTDELLVLVESGTSLSRMFQDFRRSVLVLGDPEHGVRAPSISFAVMSAIRHAVNLLARHGFRRVSLIVNSARRYAPMESSFRRICSESAVAIQANVVGLPMDLDEAAPAAERFAARIRPGHGLIALFPVSAGLLMTALMKRGLNVPREVEVVALCSTRRALHVVPVPVHYPYPVEKLAKEITKAATVFFARGKLPPMHKIIPLEVVVP
jgi:DNA-binding LacI/PurR family transcriptional regulator